MSMTHPAHASSWHLVQYREPKGKQIEKVIEGKTRYDTDVGQDGDPFVFTTTPEKE